MQPDLIITPFGESADPATIRDIPKTNPSGSPKQNASWSSGFPIVTMTPISQGGIPPEGPDLNGVLRAISRHSAFVGGGGQYKWSSEYVAANGGYPKGAVIQSDDGLVSYVSAIDGNSENFNSDQSSIGASWLFFGGPGSYFELEFEKEMQGFQDLFNTFLTNTAFEMPPIPFTEGAPIEISRPTQLVSYEGNLYSVKLPSSFPAILPGMWAVAEASLTLQTDRVLRQQLANGNGSLISLDKGSLRDAIKYVTPEMFGASPDNHDNRTFFQKALDFSAANKIPLISNNDFDISGPLYLPAFDAVWTGSGTITNTNSGTDGQMKLCLYPGTFNPVYFGMLAYKTCTPASAGQLSLMLTTTSESSTFAVGDMVFVRSTRHYNGADGIIPLYGSNNRVRSVDAATGLIGLEYPIIETLPDPEIAKTGDTGIIDVLGEREIYCCYKARVSGISFRSLNGHITERGGMLDCDINIPSIKGLSGVYTNALSFSSFNVGDIDCDLRGLEAGGCSLASIIEVGTLTWRKTGRSAAQPVVSCNENMNSCSVKIGTLSAPDFDYPSVPLVHGLSCKGNSMKVGRVLAPKLAGSIVTFENLVKNASGETQTETSGNDFNMGVCTSGDALQRFVFFSNAGGKNANNKIDGKFIGNPTVAAVTMAGDSHSVLGSYSSKNISLNVATNSYVDAIAPGGVTGFTRGSGNKIVQAHVDYEVKPKINSSQITAIGQLNGGGGALAYTPNLSQGTNQLVPFISATSLSVENPTGASEGDSFILVLKNENTTTAIAPTFGSAYTLFGEAVSPIQPGKKAMYRFSVLTNFALILESQRNGFS